MFKKVVEAVTNYKTIAETMYQKHMSNIQKINADYIGIRLQTETEAEDKRYIAELGEIHGPMLRELGLQKVLLVPLRGGELQEPLVILAQKAHVQIVIPRDEALMADDTDGASAEHHVGDVILSAHPVKFLQQLQQHRLVLIQCIHIFLPLLQTDLYMFRLLLTLWKVYRNVSHAAAIGLYPTAR